jgi:predicted DNA-binding ribbon-helix-helix protein
MGGGRCCGRCYGGIAIAPSPCVVLSWTRPRGVLLHALSTLGRFSTTMKSTVKKRSIVIGGRKTSISLEDDFWTSLQQIARSRQVTTADLIASLDAARENSNLSSAIRVFILDDYCAVAGRATVIENATCDGSHPSPSG